MKKIDYLLVGQGLAGTWLAYYLLQAGQKVLVVDEHSPVSASNIASGIVNPITGRWLVKSWMVDEILPIAKTAHQELEQFLDTRFWYNANIVWRINDQQAYNNFIRRSGMEGYRNYVADVTTTPLVSGFKTCLGYAAINQSAYVQTAHLIQTYRQFLLAQNLLLPHAFNHKDLQILPKQNGVQWQTIQAKKIIFCEGYKGMFNPYFSDLPFTPAKGEILIIEAPDLDLKGQIVKGNGFILPHVKPNQYWVGSSYITNRHDENTTETEKQNLIKRLNQMLDVPYKIIQHVAGVRPATENRRPFLGLHPSIPQIGIFNGLGTKGVSLSPYFAKEMCEHLLVDAPLNTAVNIAQYAL